MGARTGVRFRRRRTRGDFVRPRRRVSSSVVLLLRRCQCHEGPACSGGGAQFLGDPDRNTAPSTGMRVSANIRSSKVLTPQTVATPENQLARCDLDIESTYPMPLSMVVLANGQFRTSATKPSLTRVQFMRECRPRVKRPLSANGYRHVVKRVRRLDAEVTEYVMDMNGDSPLWFAHLECDDPKATSSRHPLDRAKQHLELAGLTSLERTRGG